MRDPIEEKDMMTVSVKVPAVIFEPDKHIPNLCEQFLPRESLLRKGEARGFDRAEMCEQWAEMPHNKIRSNIPCAHVNSKHGIIYHPDENHIAQDMREDGVIICPGDLLYLDNNGRVFAVSCQNGDGFRLVSNGSRVSVRVETAEQSQAPK